VAAYLVKGGVNQGVKLSAPCAKGDLLRGRVKGSFTVSFQKPTYGARADLLKNRRAKLGKAC